MSTNPCRVIALKSYDKVFNAKLADEIEAAPADAVFPRAIADYAGMRDAVRACQGLR